MATRHEQTAALHGHFHPKGKPASKHTQAVLCEARRHLPFDDTRDFEEQKKGLIAPMKIMQIKADAGLRFEIMPGTKPKTPELVEHADEYEAVPRQTVAE